MNEKCIVILITVEMFFVLLSVSKSIYQLPGLLLI